MALSSDEVGIYYNKGHAKEVEARADHVNAACCLYLENDTGGSLTSGDVVFLDTDGKVSTTTSQGKVAMILVVATNHDDTAQTIAGGASGWFQAVQRCPSVAVDGATAIGNWLVTSSTEKKAHPDSSSAPPEGSFAIALTATGGAGNVEAALIQGLGWNNDAHVAATANVHGLPASTAFMGIATSYKVVRFARVQVTPGASGTYNQAFSWDTAFSSSCDCAIASMEHNDDDAPWTCMVKDAGTSGGNVRYEAVDAGTAYINIIGIGT